MARTAEEHRAAARRAEESARESFERCDTDGFLSQWASGLSAQVHRANAKVAEAGGMGLFGRTKLVTLDGEETDARAVETRFGTRWRLDSTDEWLAYKPKRESTLAKRGYREVEVTEVAPAKARIIGTGTGLSGRAWVATLRDDLRLGEAKQWRLIELERGR